LDEFFKSPSVLAKAVWFVAGQASPNTRTRKG